MSGAVVYSEKHFPTSHSQRIHTENDNHFEVAACCMQGHRDTMEDAHSILFSLPHHKDTAFFGVFDGHAGKEASIWTAKQLPLYIDNLKEFTEDAINRACVQADEDFKQTSYRAGCAAVFAIVHPDPNAEGTQSWEIIIGNIGDSRSILIRGGVEVQTLTRDHKPENPHERQRIRNAGGFVARNRVLGSLAMSRSIGDTKYKDEPNLPPEEQMVIAVPDVTHTRASPGDHLVLFCDGIVERDVFTNKEVAQFITDYLKQKPGDLPNAISSLCTEAQRRGSGDNMSVVIVEFKGNGTAASSSKQASSQPAGEASPMDD